MVAPRLVEGQQVAQVVGGRGSGPGYPYDEVMGLKKAENADDVGWTLVGHTQEEEE